MKKNDGCLSLNCVQAVLDSTKDQLDLPEHQLNSQLDFQIQKEEVNDLTNTIIAISFSNNLFTILSHSAADNRVFKTGLDNIATEIVWLGPVLVDES